MSIEASLCPRAARSCERRLRALRGRTAWHFVRPRAHQGAPCPSGELCEASLLYLACAWVLLWGRAQQRPAFKGPAWRQHSALCARCFARMHSHRVGVRRSRSRGDGAHARCERGLALNTIKTARGRVRYDKTSDAYEKEEGESWLWLRVAWLVVRLRLCAHCNTRALPCTQFFHLCAERAGRACLVVRS